MALRPNNTQQPKLTEEEVIQVRKWFFENNWTYPEIEYETGFSYGTLRKAIHGRGKFYGSIEDGISPDLKKNRVPTKLLRKQWIYDQDVQPEHEDIDN